MKWRPSTSTVCAADLNETKISPARDDTDKLFEIVPKICIELNWDDTGSDGHDKVVPPPTARITAATTSGPGYAVGVAMNCDLLILAPGLDQVQHQMEFDAPIDFVVWRRSILLIGLSSSKIVLINPNTFQIVESRTICTMDKTPVDRFFLDAFIHSNPDPTKIDLLVLGVDGTIYTFIDVCLSSGSFDTTIDDNLSIDIDIATIKGTAHRILPQGTQISSVCCPERHFMISSDKNNNVSMFTFLDNHDKLQKYFFTAPLSEITEFEDQSLSVKKISRYDGIIFLLLSNGALELYLEEGLYFVGKVKLPSAKHVVQDFSLVVMNSDVLKLWIIFSHVEENDHFIGIGSSPRFDMEFIVRIPSSTDDSLPTFIFPTSTTLQEEPASIIEIAADGTAKVYRMEEFSTDISLKNLLLKGKFDKAELLASRYAKDMDIVWKAKVSARYAHLQVTKNETEADQVFREIMPILEGIKDPEFVCTFIADASASLPKLEWVEELLQFGLKRVEDCSGTLFGKRLLNTVKKFYTFQQVVPEGGIERWKEFSSSNTSMFLQCCEFLQKLLFNECEIIWLRHCDEFLAEIQLSQFAPFFRTLFWHRLDSDSAVSLFQTIFPHALDKCERNTAGDGDGGSKISALVYLVTSQIRNLEREIAWPKEGIDFVEVLVKAVEEEETKLHEMSDLNESRHLERAAICTEILDKLRTILQALNELSQLYSNHKIRILFDKYLDEPKLDVINLMVGVIWGKEEVEYFLKDFLFPFAKRHDLNVDEIIEQHIGFLANEVTYYMRAESIPFENRVVTLTDNIESSIVRLRCVHALSQAWPVPWRPPMEGIVSRALQLSVEGDPEAAILQKTIQIIKVQVPYRCLRYKYNLSASKCVHGYHVVHTIKRILKADKPEAYEDCLELIKHTGKCDAEGVRKLKFWYELSETAKPLDEIVETDFSEELIQRLLNRILEQFRQAPDLLNKENEPWERYTECGKLLANRIQDHKALQFFQLRKILKNFWSTDMLYSKEYPFSVLRILLEENRDASGPHMIRLCHRLAQISFSHVKDILLTAASFFCNDGLRGSEMAKIWEIVTEIVRLPGNFHAEGDIVPGEGVALARHLAKYIPTSSDAELDTLEAFYNLIFSSFETETAIIEPILNVMSILSMFRELRDREIPLETAFLNIYLEVWIQGRKGATGLLPELTAFGESLLRFGDTELFARIFSAIHAEYLNQASFAPPKMQADRIQGAAAVNQLKNTLLANIDQYQVEETNSRVVNLVKALQAAGLQLNAYALRQRSKGRLIAKLIEMNKYPLASQTALVFSFRDGPSWSLILREYIAQASTAELKTLLESLKKINELWVVPEFKEAWLKVSEKFPNFRHICPIPLGN